VLHQTHRAAVSIASGLLLDPRQLYLIRPAREQSKAAAAAASDEHLYLLQRRVAALGGYI
jgi:hypothetical protein